MKTIFLLVIISLFINDVFGDKVENERVSVNDGGSVTLHNHADLKRVNVITWRFNGERIAKINKEVNGKPGFDSDERFTDRLKMNPQTGDLTITNIRSERTGYYQLEINGMTIIKTFSVSLSPKVKAVIVEDSVSLHIDVTDEQRKDKIHWRIKHNNSLVANISTENGEISTPFIDERFRDRVKLEDQTGDVIITNMKKEDSGEYEADVTIGSNTHTIHKTFSYTAPEVSGEFNNDDGKDDGSSTGRSPGVTAGIIAVAAVAAVAGVVAAAVAVGVIFIKKRPQDATRGKKPKEITEPLKNGDSNGYVPPV